MKMDRKTKRELREKSTAKPSDIQFASIIEKINEGFVALDAQMNYVYINKRGSELLRREPENLIGKNYWDEYPEDKNTSFGQAYLRALETRTAIELEDYYAERDRWFENRVYPSDEGGLSIFFNDITERKRAEAGMRENEERFQTLANGSPVLLWVNGLEGSEFVNREYLDFLGLDPQTDVRSYDWSEFVHPEDREAYQNTYLRAFENQTEFSTEFRFRRYDGEYRWMRSEATPRRAADGSFAGYVGASIDITVRKQAELAMQKSEHQLRLLTDAMPALISYIDSEFRYRFVNQAYRDWFGYENEEVIDRTAMEVLGAAAFERLRPHMEAALAGKTEIFESETPYQRGGTRFIRATYTPDIAADGAINGFFVLVLDITERKQAEESLAEYARQQAALYQLTDRLQHTKTLEDTFNGALDAILSALQCHRASILLFDNADVMRFVAWRDLSDDYRTATDGHSPWKPDEENPEPIIINDIHTAELSDSLKTMIRNEGIGSLAFIPLVFNGKLIGKFMTYFNEPHEFTEREIDLSLTIAHQLAIGIERKRDEDALRTSEANLRLATQTARMFSWEFDIQKQAYKVADNFSEAVGFSSSLVPKDNQEILQRYIHPEDTHLVVEGFTKAIQSGSDLPIVQCRLLNPETVQPVWLEMSGKIVYDRNGNPERIFGVAQNITERKDNEQQLIEKARLLDLSNDAIIVRDSKDRVIYWNDGAERVYGWQREEVLGKVTHEILQTEHPEPLEKIVDSLLRNGHWSGELVHARRDGERLVTFSRWVMERNAQGHIGSIMETNTDITERKHVEDLLRSERELLARLFETMPVMVSMYDPTTDSLRLNVQFEQLIGWKTEELTVTSLLERLYPDPEYRDNVLQRMGAASKDEWVEVRVHTRDGRTLDSLWSNISIMNDQQLVIGIAIGIDITERKQAEKRLALLAEVSELTRKIEVPNELMYAISNAVGEHLHVRRCLFNETDLERDLEIVHSDYHNGVDSVAGEHKISDYSSITSTEMISGKTVVNYDSKIDPRTAQDYERTYAVSGERAYVAVPLMREGRWVGTFWVSDDEPRQWSQEEVSLLETIAERTWAAVERARAEEALAKSEEKYRTLFNSMDEGYCVIEFFDGPHGELSDYVHVEANPAYTANAGIPDIIGQKVREMVPDEADGWVEIYRNVLITGQPVQFERELVATGRHLELSAFRIEPAERRQVAVMFKNITERKRMENEKAQLLEREQAQRISAEEAKLEAEQAKAEAERELAERRMAEAALGEWADAPLPQDKRSAGLRYGAAFVVTLIAVLVRLLLDPFLGNALELVTIYAAVAFSVWFGGVGPALLSALLGYLAISGLIVEPRGVVILDAQTITGFALFLFSNTVVMALGETMRRAQRHAHQSARVAIERQHQAESRLLEKQSSEEALRRSEQMFSTLVDASPFGVYFIDSGFRLQAVNKGSEAVFRDIDPLIGRDFAEILRIIWKEPFASEAIARFRHTLETGESFISPPIIEQRGNIDQIEAYDWQIHRITLSDGTYGVVCYFYDLSEQKQMEATVRASEELYRTIARSIPGGGVYVIDKDFRYLIVEGSVTETFGLSRDILEGRTVMEVFPDERGERMEERLRKNFAGENVEFETQFDGHSYWTQMAPLHDSIGQAIILTLDITERKQAEEALRRSEERFARFMQYLPGLAWIKDTDGRYIYANEAASRVFNTPIDELYGKTDEEIFPAEVAAQFRNNDELALMDEKGVQVTETLKHQDGQLHYSLVSKFPIPGPDGSTTLIGGTAFDITERLQAEEALRESEARLRAVFDGTYEYIGLLSPEGTLLEANRAALEFDHNTREEVIGRPFWETPWWAYTPGAQESLRNAIERAANGEPIRYEAPLNRRSGETIIFDFSLHPVRDEQGEVMFLVPEGRNITERKKAEDALYESEERFRAILGQATAGIVRKDAEGRLIFVNQAFCNMLGLTEADLLGKMIWDFTHPDDLEQNKRLYERTMIEGVPFKLEKRLIRADGSIVWVDVSVSPILDVNGKPQSAVAVEVDITGRKQAEHALRESEERYRALFNSIDEGFCVIEKVTGEDDEPIDFRYIEANPAFAANAGRDDVVGQTIRQAYPGEAEEWFQTYDTVLRTGESMRFERGLVTQGRVLELYAFRVKDETYARVAVLFKDITERKRAEEELQQLNLQLESRVQRRTGELQTANQSLLAEIASRQRVEDALQESRRRLQMLSQRLVDVQEEERRAIARELHDRVGQSLSALNINLVILDNQISDRIGEPIRSRLDDSMQLVAETITLVRDVMSDLRPPVLDDYGLEAALQSQLSAFKSRYGIDVLFEKPEQPIPRLSASIEMTFVRIAQEALMNVARHAKAGQVTLSLMQDEKMVRLIIQDNGEGIRSWQEANRPGSHGLTIMRERAEAFGGNLKVSSIPGKGVKVDASIPIDSDGPENAQKERSE